MVASTYPPFTLCPGRGQRKNGRKLASTPYKNIGKWWAQGEGQETGCGERERARRMGYVGKGAFCPAVLLCNAHGPMRKPTNPSTRRVGMSGFIGVWVCFSFSFFVTFYCLVNRKLSATCRSSTSLSFHRLSGANTVSVNKVSSAGRAAITLRLCNAKGTRPPSFLTIYSN